MKVLVTGSKGYIGSVLSNELIKKNHDVVGIDTGFFLDCAIEKIEENYKFINKDIRDIQEEDLKGIDAVIHLAALSNDPLGEFNPKLTEEINLKGTIKLAELCKSQGISRFIYVSSQSMYGISNVDIELDEYKSEKNPITSYAKTKWEAEQELKKMCDKYFCVVSFRPSTVFGFSPRLRCDIVFNNFVACAYTTKSIEVKSDGTPWRPVIHIKDVCKALSIGLEAPKNIINGNSYNIGYKNGNYSVRDLAEAASRSIPGSKLLFTGEHSDSRTYRVSFKRIFEELGEWFKPDWDLDKGAKELVMAFDKIDFNEKVFRGSMTNRLLKLKELTIKNKLDTDLRWI
tara:strand:+ start:2214 stop:3242 length:1029 start_codon:yes stop_codon:yes gene_type:complete